jgi:hypothetical protein
MKEAKVFLKEFRSAPRPRLMQPHATRQIPRHTFLATGIIPWLKYQDVGRMSSSGNVYSFYCRAVSCKATYLSGYQDIAIAQARVLQPVPATVPSLQNTCFFGHSSFRNQQFL